MSDLSRICILFTITLSLLASDASADDLSASLTRAEALAKTVTIHRDNWGVPHIYAPTDVNVAFGMAYVNVKTSFGRSKIPTFAHLVATAKSLDQPLWVTTC